jgi:hypothetical protein
VPWETEWKAIRQKLSKGAGIRSKEDVSKVSLVDGLGRSIVQGRRIGRMMGVSTTLFSMKVTTTLIKILDVYIA